MAEPTSRLWLSFSDVCHKNHANTPERWAAGSSAGLAPLGPVPGRRNTAPFDPHRQSTYAATRAANGGSARFGRSRHGCARRSRGAYPSAWMRCARPDLFARRSQAPAMESRKVPRAMTVAEPNSRIRNATPPRCRPLRRRRIRTMTRSRYRHHRNPAGASEVRASRARARAEMPATRVTRKFALARSLLLYAGRPSLRRSYPPFMQPRASR